jgi:histidyl-tRNA synthetase
VADITAVKGVKDILPEEVPRWEEAERRFRAVFGNYGYREIRIPTFEDTQLFRRSIGEETDIVEKEMYTFTDKGGSSITLRPEGTASVVRAFIEHSMAHLPQPVKLFYLGPMFRHERPQKGRLRQFHQAGAEVFGLAGPEAEAELLEMVMQLLTREFGLQDLSLQVNTLGDDACRPAYRQALTGYLEIHRHGLCENCRRRLERNPLRVLDCKAEGCRAIARGAPVIGGVLCGECRSHFDRFLSLLDEAGVPHQVNPHLVRGLDYYTRTTFEVLGGSGLGAQNAVAAGGRYDNLVAAFGGPPTPGLGFALGMERLLALLPPEFAGTGPRVLYLAAADGEGRLLARSLARSQRARGVAVALDLLGRSLKAQMRAADSMGAAWVVVLGAQEAASGRCVLKEMTGGWREEIALADLGTALERRM